MRWFGMIDGMHANSCFERLSVHKERGAGELSLFALMHFQGGFLCTNVHTLAAAYTKKKMVDMTIIVPPMHCRIETCLKDRCRALSNYRSVRRHLHLRPDQKSIQVKYVPRKKSSSSSSFMPSMLESFSLPRSRHALRFLLRIWPSF